MFSHEQRHPRRAGRVTARVIIHVDMDAFYASVEQRDAPELRGLPVIVGGHPTRGVVLAASYEVRPFGVRSAIPMARAVALAPHAIVVPPRPAAYAAASEQVFSIFHQYTPLVEPLSLDEAFLDVTASLGLFGRPADIAARIRREIREQTELAASAGIADVKLVAKIASDLAKPDGQLEVPPGGAAVFLAPLPIKRLWGVGPRTEERLLALGVRTIGDLARAEPRWLTRKLGSFGAGLRELARGVDPRPVVPDREAKSLGAEDTFAEDVVGDEALRPHVHAQALRVARRMRAAGVRARVVQLKVKHGDHTTVTRRTTLAEPTDDGQELFRVAAAMLTEAHGGRPVRLTGVSAQDLSLGAAQMLLLDDGVERRTRLNAALDRINDRFGSRAVTTADLGGGGDDADDEARRRMGASRNDVPGERGGRRPGRGGDSGRGSS